MGIPAVIDVDTGTDDAIALIMAANSPELDIRGITTSGGNASLAHTTRNTLRLMSAIGRSDVPISKGADRPLRGSFEYAYHYHGPGGMTAPLPAADLLPVEKRAPEYLIESAAQLGGELTIIALGPLTNVARAIRREPSMRDMVSHVFVMGGAVEVGGNVTPNAEFNIYADPYAASVVFDSGLPVTLVGLDIGDEVGFAREDEDWRSGDSPGQRLAARIIEGWFAIHPDRDTYVLCDPMTVAVALAPDLFEFRQASVSVDEDGVFRGRTRAIYGEGNVRVALTVAVEQARALTLERLASPTD